MKKIPMYIESLNGHDTTLVPENKIVEETVKQVQDGKWATLENKDGTSEILTKADIEETEPDPNDEDKDEDDDDDLDEEDKELASGWQGTLSGKAKTPTPVKPSKPSASLVKKFEKVTSVTCTKSAKGG